MGFRANVVLRGYPVITELSKSDGLEAAQRPSFHVIVVKDINCRFLDGLLLRERNYFH
jgi:hypothetical protein